MRYKSLLSVDIILVDGRIRSAVLAPILNQCLIALNRGLSCHVVVLCTSIQQADEVDNRGEQADQEMFFHGEPCPTNEEIAALAHRAKLIISGDGLPPDIFPACAPFLSITKAATLYYPGGMDAAAPLSTSLLQCLESIARRE